MLVIKIFEINTIIHLNQNIYNFYFINIDVTLYGFT